MHPYSAFPRLRKRRGRAMIMTKRIMSLSGGGLLVLAGLLISFRGPLAAATAPAQADLSREAAASAESKFRQIQESSASGHSFGSIRLTETELNSFAHYYMEPEFPPGFSKLQLKLQPGRPHGTAEVDLDKLKATLKTPPNPVMAYFLQGQHTLGVAGTLSAANGICQFHLEAVTLDDLALPEPVVDFLIEHYLKSRYPDVATDRPFALGFGIDKLNVESGSVLLTSRSTGNTRGLPGAVLLPLLK